VGKVEDVEAVEKVWCCLSSCCCMKLGCSFSCRSEAVVRKYKSCAEQHIHLLGPATDQYAQCCMLVLSKPRCILY
jgi:hypothetical protein